MNRVTCVLVLAVLLLSVSTSSQAEKEAMAASFEFALIGDTPYDAAQEKEFTNVMRQVNAAELAFVVHDGDFAWDGIGWTAQHGGHPPCSDETFQDRLSIAQSSRHPFILVPGDNDWSDCYRAKPRTYDPLERLAKLRQMFFKGDQSLGQRTMRLTRQSEDSQFAEYRENVRWSYGDVLFVALHIVGSNNNLGRTPDMDAEYARRHAASVAWLSQAFDLAKRSGNKAVMIVAHADPRFENSWPEEVQQRYMLAGLGFKSPEVRRATGFDDFLAALEKETLAFGRPVVYVHGDTHIFRIDKPLFGSTSRRSIENFTRVATFGHPNSHWIRAIVDPSDPQVFSFRQEIVRENLVAH